MMKVPNIAVLLVAAGKGTRLGGDIPKQYRDLGGISVLRRTIDAFSGIESITTIAVVIDAPAQDLYQAASQGCVGLLPPIMGGLRRQDSVRLGLEALSASSPDFVLIHDAARPFVARDLIRSVITALGQFDAVVPALPVTDTLKRGDGLQIVDHLDRKGLYRAQTPQAFRFDRILAAHRQYQGTEEMTDDAAMAQAAGLKVATIIGSEQNFKITTTEDLMRAEQTLVREYRTGNGFDVHKLIPGDHLFLCGVKIEHDHALEGHSDADVALHALTDAIFGAIGDGDIGHHFPPSDPKWQGAASWQFLDYAVKRVRARQGKITHIDLTLICERPKISPHREAMIKRLAQIIGIAPGRVSVKATTTEKLGFTGRGEGIAAQATATIALPCHD